MIKKILGIFFLVYFVGASHTTLAEELNGFTKSNTRSCSTTNTIGSINANPGYVETDPRWTNEKRLKLFENAGHLCLNKMLSSDEPATKSIYFFNPAVNNRYIYLCKWGYIQKTIYTSPDIVTYFPSAGPEEPLSNYCCMQEDFSYSDVADSKWPRTCTDLNKNPASGGNATAQAVGIGIGFDLNTYDIKTNDYLSNPEYQYNCGLLNCIIQPPDFDKILPQKSYTESEINNQNLYCVKHKETLNRAAGTVCCSGKSATKEECDKQGSGNEMLQCDSYQEPEATYCKECFGKNGSEDVSQFTYTQLLGCVDVSRTGLIARAFQVGLGIFGFIAILRFIQAAFMRQSGDPAKIQEGNEIIISTILGLLALVATIPILNLVGIDILGILPFGFFQ